MAGARHLELVEERADVVLVDVSENELVERERLVVLPLVLKVHRAVVRDEARVLAQPEAHELYGVVLLPEAVASP